MTLDRKSLMIGAALVAALGVGFGAAKLTAPPSAPPPAEEHEEEGGAGDLIRLTPQQAQAAGVMTVTIAQGDGGDLRLIGRVEAAPQAHAAVASPVSGSIQRLLVSPGARVQVGAGLVAIRSPEGASLAAEASAARAEAHAATSALGREERLFKEGVVSRQDWEVARAAATRATAAATAAQARAKAAGTPNAAGELIVRSPISGVLTAMPATRGAFVAEGALLADVADPTQLEIVFNAPAEAASRLRQDQVLRVLGPDGAEASAIIVGVAPLSQDATGAALVRARPTGGRLTPGSAVSASVRSGEGTGLAVPSEAVQTLNGMKVVFVAEPNGFRAKPITVGRSGAGYTEVVAGLTGRESIAGRGAFILKAELAKSEAEHEH